MYFLSDEVRKQQGEGSKYHYDGVRYFVYVFNEFFITKIKSRNHI